MYSIQQLEEEVTELLEKLYEVLSEKRYKIVKRKVKGVTAFHHLASVASTAAIICMALEDLGHLPQGSWKECFWGGVVHDYEKIWKDIPKEVTEVSGVSEKELEKLALCTEALAGGSKELRLKCYALSLADYWASQVSVTNYLPPGRYKVAYESLKELGIAFAPLYSGLPKAVMSDISEKLFDLFFKRGWYPIMLYADGVLFIGDEEVSQRVDRGDVAELIYGALLDKLRGGESAKQSMEKSLKPFVNFASELESLVNLNEEELKKEVDDAFKREKKKILPALAAALVKGYRDIATEIEEKIKNDKKKFQVRAVLGSPYYLEEIIKQGLGEEFLKMLGDGAKKASLLAFAITMYRKGQVSEYLKKYRKEYGLEETELRNPFQPLVFAKVAAKLLKLLESGEKQNIIGEIVEWIKSQRVDDSGLRKFAEYLACAELSSPILQGKCKTVVGVKGRCFICGSPIFSNEFLFEHYYTYAQGSKGGVEVYSPRQRILSSIESGRVKPRHICPACAFEAVLINSRLSTPFIAFAAHPSVSYFVMKYIASRLVGILQLTIADLCKGLSSPGAKGSDYLLDYAHALSLLKFYDVGRDDRGFAGHGAAIAKFLARAGYILEAAGGGQVALAWEIPLNLSGEPTSAPQLPAWVVETLGLSFRSDSLAPLIHALKAWALKVCSLPRDVNKLRDAFYYSDAVPHPSLALLSPPKGFKGSEVDSFYNHFSRILKEVEGVERYMSEGDRLISRLWAYAYAIANALKASGSSLSKHKVQSPLRNALYRLVDYLEMGLNENDAIELASGVAQEDAERTFGPSVNVESPTKKVLQFAAKYIREMNPSKRRQFFEDLLDVVYLMTRKALSGVKGGEGAA